MLTLFFNSIEYAYVRKREKSIATSKKKSSRFWGLNSNEKGNKGKTK